MQTFIQDLRFASRMIWKRPTASAVIVLTLALGIGVNATFFSSFYGMVLRPLPFAEPQELVMLHESQPALGKTRQIVSAPNLRDWIASNTVFEGIGAYRFFNYNLHSDDEPERVEGASISAALFPMLGVEPALGRNFLSEEDLPGGPAAVLLSHELWERHFASDPTVIGRTLRLDDEPREIVGVMPPGFQFPNHGQIWTPLALDPHDEDRGARRLHVIARLKAGIGLEHAQAALRGVAERLEALYPEANSGRSVHVRSLHDAWLPPVTQVVAFVQQCLVGFVLLIVCANVANMILAQATVRRRENALRAALGASRWRLIRQALTESSLLAFCGGVLGTLFALWGAEGLGRLASVPIPYWLRLEFSPQALLYTLANTLVTGLVIGLLPAVRSSGLGLFAILKAGDRTYGRSGSRLRGALVVCEYAMSLVILIGALLMVKSYLRVQQADAGFDPDRILTIRLSLTGKAHGTEMARGTFLEQALRRIEGLAEVESAGAVNYLPISQLGYRPTPLEVEGQHYATGEEPVTTYHTISRHYLRTLAIPLRRGRTFTAGEIREGGDVVLVSEALAARLWPGEDPLGRRIRTMRSESDSWLTVVGVVGEVKSGQPIADVDSRPATEIYRPMAAGPPVLPMLVVRSRSRPAAITAAVLSELRAVDASVPAFDILTMEDVLARYYFAQQIWSRMFSILAALAVTIAALGAYGVIAYSVSQRRVEMGIRIALGARPESLVKLVIWQGVGLGAWGVGLGLAGVGLSYVVFSDVMSTALHGVSPTDPGVFALVIGILVAVALLASYLPARRAARVDPIEVLQSE